jgi:hypothetical protein
MDDRTVQLALTNHTLDVTFRGVIGDIISVTMRRSEEGQSEPLFGKTLKIGEGVFWVGLSNSEKAQTYNLRLANEVSWFDVPMVYSNHRRAILSVEKGASGSEIFEKAFTIWKIRQRPVRVVGAAIDQCEP